MRLTPEGQRGRGADHRAAADGAHRGTLEFTAGRITGPAAEIVASAVTESPADRSRGRQRGQGPHPRLQPRPRRRPRIRLPSGGATTANPGSPGPHARPLIGRSGLRGAQSDLVCAPQSMITEESPTDQNGGSGSRAVKPISSGS
jgi:hypothetical protein